MSIAGESDHSDSGNEEEGTEGAGLACSSIDETTESSILLRFRACMPHDCGDCNDPCAGCGALHWKLERTQRTMAAASTSYSACCQQGAVGLPSDHLEDGLTPAFLRRLFTEQDRS